MLYLSLIASGLLLLGVNWMVRRPRVPGSAIGCTGLAGLAVMVCISFAMPAVAIQAALLVVVALISRGTRRPASAFLWLSCAATLTAYSIVAVLALPAMREYDYLRGMYPFESMEARVPAPKAASGGTTFRPATLDRLSLLDERVPEHSSIRKYLLKTLHEDSVAQFVNSPGFGVSRSIRPSVRVLNLWLRHEPVPPQPGTRLDEMWSPGEWRPAPPADEAPLGDLLVESIADFVNPRGFGYIKDRRHVAGFVSHGFSRVPGPAKRWTVQTLDLVSLLLHDEPRVYVSDQLPAMADARNTPTRPLDRFERFALETLERGEDLFVSEAGDGLRMLGAVRSVKQCVKCHGGSRGDLLGAFSYTLRSAGHAPVAGKP
jgi:hypothetical protein